MEHADPYGNGRISWMLKEPTILMCFALLACNGTANSIDYCQSQETMSINFQDRLISLESHGTADQRSNIIACADSIRVCFMGEISFVNPFLSEVSENPNVESVERIGSNDFRISTIGNGTRTSYRISRGEEFPAKLMIRSLRTGESHVFSRC